MIDYIFCVVVGVAIGILICDGLQSWMVLRGWPRAKLPPLAIIVHDTKLDIGPALRGDARPKAPR